MDFLATEINKAFMPEKPLQFFDTKEYQEGFKAGVRETQHDLLTRTRQEFCSDYKTELLEKHIKEMKEDD